LPYLHGMISAMIQSNGPCDARVVRSINGMSIGKTSEMTERGIVAAYLRLIKNAQNFVYIENQYFIEDKSDHAISSAIVDRILKAHEQKKPFRIVVVLPLLPDNGEISSSIVQTIMQLQQETIQRIFIALELHQINALQYINFYGLLNHDKLNGKLVTAQIYVHSKVMLADECAIIGSANINKRSLRGDRDSEISIVIHNKEFCSNLVKKLLFEHSGKQCTDDICQFMCVTLSEIAAINSHNYKMVFGNSVPGCARNVKSFMASIHNIIAGDEHNYLQRISGHVVEYPLGFIADNTRSRWYSSWNPMRRLVG